MLTDHIVVLLFAGLYPAYDFFYASKKFEKNAEANKPGVRIRAYKSGIAGIWILSLLALLSWIVNEREFVDFGLNFSLDWTLWSALGLGILALVYIIYLFKSLKGDTEQISALRARMDGPTTSLYLPRTKNEYRWFVFVSLSAGICEELLYRGFLMWYISQYSSMIVAVIVSSLLFGIAHAYQGWKGMIQTGLLGLVFALIYFFTASLWIPIALHIAIDVYSGLLGWLAFDEAVDVHKE